MLFMFQGVRGSRRKDIIINFFKMKVRRICKVEFCDQFGSSLPENRKDFLKGFYESPDYICTSEDGESFWIFRKMKDAE